MEKFYQFWESYYPQLRVNARAQVGVVLRPRLTLTKNGFGVGCFFRGVAGLVVILGANWKWIKRKQKWIGRKQTEFQRKKVCELEIQWQNLRKYWLWRWFLFWNETFLFWTNRNEIAQPLVSFYFSGKTIYFFDVANNKHISLQKNAKKNTKKAKKQVQWHLSKYSFLFLSFLVENLFKINKNKEK